MRTIKKIGALLVYGMFTVGLVGAIQMLVLMGLWSYVEPLNPIDLSWDQVVFNLQFVSFVGAVCIGIPFSVILGVYEKVRRRHVHRLVYLIALTFWSSIMAWIFVTIRVCSYPYRQIVGEHVFAFFVSLYLMERFSTPLGNAISKETDKIAL
ncbi:MAG: hypothetical protein K8U03_05600 [Planctomycetia bacterium]|nr:hypothetical protein [Planctomycetia bacterium]